MAQQAGSSERTPGKERTLTRRLCGAETGGVGSLSRGNRGDLTRAVSRRCLTTAVIGELSTLRLPQ
jgi:hypothetical protein